MRTTIAIASFLVVGASAVGVSALDLRGSDTLQVMTVNLLTDATLDCGGLGNTPAGDLVYIGSGSGNGQSSLVGNTQEIAPMSRAMNTGVCTGTAASTNHANATLAEGIVFALDGISVVANSAFASCAGSPTCNTDVPVNGLRSSGQIPGTSFTVADWRDALRLLFMGSTSTTLANRNCASPQRAALAANWNNIFQTCNTGACPAGIQHAFRRNDESGTTDTFVSLLGVTAIGLGTHISPFCNTRTTGAGGVNAAGTPTTQSVINAAEVIPPPPAGRTPFIATNITVCGNTANGYRGSNFTDFQDGDVIRRACVFTAGAAKEDVCSARGDLGLVLPIWDAPQVDAFPTANCSPGFFACFPAPRTNCTPPNVFETCPNGHDANIAGLCPVGQCAAPIISGGGVLDPRCNASRGTNAPGDLTGVVYDGRVHNLTTWNAAGANFVKAPVVRATGLPLPVPATTNVGMTGAYYRIHSINSIATPAVQCRAGSATDQISCLVQASPCSIAFAGNSAVQGNTIALNVNNAAPTNECVQNLVDGTGSPYPLSRKLYLSSLDGFETLVAGTSQFKMANCFASGAATTKAVANGFIPLPTAPFCEDFDETQAGCNLAGGTNTNACAGNPF
jgi:ABC-type phosphate transport system substrate-binding protein